MNATPYLDLDCIQTNHQLMRLLPSEVAYHFHALPVATDGERITIAMASPEDITASAAVASNIGAPISFVQADLDAIDRRLDEIWPETITTRQRLLVWSPTPATETTLLPYVNGLAEMLNADLEQVDIPWRGTKSFSDLRNAAEQAQPDLIVFQVPNPSLLKRLLTDFATQKWIDRLPVSVLIPFSPRWPVKNILLTLPNGNKANDMAIDWTVQFARSSLAAVTVLPLLPPVPGMYRSVIQHNFQAILSSTDPMGQKMRWLSQRFSEEKVTGVFKLREGEPLEQLRNEILASDPDLVVVAAEHRNCLWRWVNGELVTPLLGWANRPILISKNK